MDYLLTKHSNFLRDFGHSTRLFASNVTAIPSFIFLMFSAILLYFHFHRFTTSFTAWSTCVSRDAIFHVAYFYITRAWFMLMRLFKLIHSQLLLYIERYVPEREQKINIFLTKLCLLTMVFAISLVPFLLFMMKLFYQDSVPNFLIWIDEDPFVRTEMGTCGHFLSRSPRLVSLESRENAYRSKRSISVDSEIWKNSRPRFVRNCKSMLILNRASNPRDHTM